MTDIMMLRSSRIELCEILGLPMTSLPSEVHKEVSQVKQELTRLTEIAAAKATRCDELFEELERVAPDSPLLEKIRNESN